MEIETRTFGYPQPWSIPNRGHGLEESGGSRVGSKRHDVGRHCRDDCCPWFLAERSGTSVHWVIIFDILLAIHGCWLILPKRYAITKDALWVDGFSVDWNRLWWSGYAGGSSITLQRKGWWRLAPLPLGGSEEDLAAAALRIDAILIGEWDTLKQLLDQEE